LNLDGQDFLDEQDFGVVGDVHGMVALWGNRSFTTNMIS
jgi:hypothetical protein